MTGDGWGRTGWIALWRKEWRQGWRSFRIPALWLTLAFFALMDPLVSRHMEALVRLAAPGIQITLPPTTPALAMEQFLGDVVQIGILALALIAAPAVAGERREGVTAWLLARPVSRAAYLGAKLGVLMAATIAGICASCAVAWTYAWTLYQEPPPAGPVLLAGAAALLLALLVVSASFAASVFAPSNGAASGVSVALYVLLILGGSVLGRAAWARWLPFALVAQASTLQGTGSAGDVLPAAAGTLVLAAGLLGYAFAGFRRAELA